MEMQAMNQKLQDMDLEIKKEEDKLNLTEKDLKKI